MEVKNKDVSKRTKKFSISIILYVAAAVVAIIGVALLFNNIILFKKTVAQYVSQGYAAATVTSQLIPSQLLPGIFESFAMYGGIAIILLAAGIINKKVSRCLEILDKVESCEVNEDVNAEKNDLEESNITLEDEQLVE